MASAHVSQPIVLNDDNFSWQSQSRTVHTQVLFRLARYLTPALLADGLWKGPRGGRVLDWNRAKLLNGKMTLILS